MIWYGGADLSGASASLRTSPQRSPDPLDDLGVPRAVVALIERYVSLVTDRQHSLVRHRPLLIPWIGPADERPPRMTAPRS
jgi:hypothetical protein